MRADFFTLSDINPLTAIDRLIGPVHSADFAAKGLMNNVHIRYLRTICPHIHTIYVHNYKHFSIIVIYYFVDIQKQSILHSTAKCIKLHISDTT